MNRPYSTYASKLGGFDLLHSIEDRNLHNAFCPKALIPAPEFFWLPFTSLSTQANRNASVKSLTRAPIIRQGFEAVPASVRHAYAD